MSTTVTFQAFRMTPPSSGATSAPSVETTQEPASALASSPVTHGFSASPQAQPTREETERDPSSGLTVFRTVEAYTNTLVAQFPTEAYLRLANAMKDSSRDADGVGKQSHRTV
jgi:hypothetical protein